MRRIKLFKGVENELAALESDINRWLESEQVELVGVTGNIAPQTHFAASPESFSASDVLIIVTYEVPDGQ